MEYVLTGFQQEIKNVRRYAFERIEADKKRRTPFSVGVDMELIRKYQIPVQELPLLCHHFLAAQAGEEVASGTFMFSESDMLAYASHRTAAKNAADLKRRPPRRPATAKTGQAWRVSGAGVKG